MCSYNNIMEGQHNIIGGGRGGILIYEGILTRILSIRQYYCELKRGRCCQCAISGSLSSAVTFFTVASVHTMKPPYNQSLSSLATYCSAGSSNMSNNNCAFSMTRVMAIIVVSQRQRDGFLLIYVFSFEKKHIITNNC